MYKYEKFSNLKEMTEFLNKNKGISIVSIQGLEIIYSELKKGDEFVYCETVRTFSDGSRQITQERTDKKNGAEVKTSDDKYFDASGNKITKEEFDDMSRLAEKQPEESVAVHDDIVQNENIETVTEYVENGTHKKIAVFKDGHEVIITNGEAVVLKDGQQVDDIAHLEEIKAYTEANKKD